MNNNEGTTPLIPSKIIEAREIGIAVDGRLVEVLVRESESEFRFIYLVILTNPNPRKYRLVSIVNTEYDIARCWYELQHPKGSFPDDYKPEWAMTMERIENELHG